MQANKQQTNKRSSGGIGWMVAKGKRPRANVAARRPDNEEHLCAFSCHFFCQLLGNANYANPHSGRAPRHHTPSLLPPHAPYPWPSCCSADPPFPAVPPWLPRHCLLPDC
jgi:hypothetical protein